MLWCGQMQLHRIQFLKIDENLTSVQRWELDVVLDDFSEVLDDIPGQTDITAHHIRHRQLITISQSSTQNSSCP